MAELLELFVVTGAERAAQGIDFLGAVLDENRNQILEVLGDDGGIVFVEHRGESSLLSMQ